MEPQLRERRIEELRGSLRRGCAGPRKYARRKLVFWKRELDRLVAERG